MTKIEKQMIAAMVVFVMLMAASLYCLSRAFSEIDQNGGVKAVVERAWNGAPAKDSTHD